MAEIIQALVVEDDLPYLDTLRRLLEEVGFRVDFATDANAPVKPAEGVYAVALVDVSLRPGGEDQLGVGVARRIKTSCPQTAVILVTGAPAVVDSPEAKAEVLGNSRADALITKSRLTREGSSALLGEIQQLVPSAHLLWSAGTQARSSWKEAARRRIEQARARRQGLPNVLLVEDRRHWQDILQELIERAGGFADIVETYQEAMNHIQRQPYAAAVVDLRLDGLSSDNREGKAFIEDAIEKCQGIPFFVVSGLVDEEMKRSLVRLGVSRIDDKSRLHRDAFRFVGDLREVLANHLPVTPEDWPKMIWDFLKACRKSDASLDETALAKYPRFAGARSPGEAAYVEVRKLIRAKIEDKSLPSHKRQWLAVLEAYYLGAEPLSWEDLEQTKKFPVAKRTLKYYAKRGLKVFAEIAYEAFGSSNSKSG